MNDDKHFKKRKTTRYTYVISLIEKKKANKSKIISVKIARQGLKIEKKIVVLVLS